MSGGQENAPCGVTADTGRDGRFATAAGNPKLAENRTARDRRGSLFIAAGDGGEPVRLRVTGRDAWALRRLIAAGAKGCTPIEQPAPRWSAYIFNLRRRGVVIETIHEPHGGEFAGTHARYVLRSIVREGGGA